MNELFTGLSKQQTMLLLTAVTFGGQEGMQALEHLPEDHAELLRERARLILQIPREKRVPFLVQEIKKLVTSKKTEGLREADVERVALALRGERPSVVEVLLRALPADLAGGARRALSQPPVRLSRDIRPDLLAVLRWQFEEKLARASMPPRVLTLGDLPSLTTAELCALSDVLGARTIAPALAAVDEPERTRLLQRLSPEQRRVAARPPDPGRRMGLELARRWIQSTFEVPEVREAVRDLGIRRVARACLATSPELASEVAAAHRDTFGRSLAFFAAEERDRPRRQGDEACRLDVLAQLEKLAAGGVVDRPSSPPGHASKAAWAAQVHGAGPAARARAPFPAGAEGPRRKP